MGGDGGGFPLLGGGRGGFPLLGGGRGGYRRRKRKIRAGIERRINVNQIDLARKFGQQARQHVFFIAPDQTVAPCRRALSGGEEFQRPLALLRGFVDGFNRLERQRDGERRDFFAVLRQFSCPMQFGHNH